MTRSGLLSAIAFSAPSLLLLLPSSGAFAAQDLQQLRGKARPVIILSDSRDDPRVAKQISALDHVKPEIDERNISVLSESDRHGALHKSLGVARRGFAVVLVGKDGQVKKIWRDPVNPKQIFTVIDRMPMRQKEMNG